MEDVVIRSGRGPCTLCDEVHENVLSLDDEGFVSMWKGCGEPEDVNRLTPAQAIELVERREHALYGDGQFMTENNRNAKVMLAHLRGEPLTDEETQEHQQQILIIKSINETPEEEVAARIAPLLKKGYRVVSAQTSLVAAGEMNFGKMIGIARHVYYVTTVVLEIN